MLSASPSFRLIALTETLILIPHVTKIGTRSGHVACQIKICDALVLSSNLYNFFGTTDLKLFYVFHDCNLLLPSRVLVAQSFTRFMYCCLSTFVGIKIFWYVCKMRGQVNKILSRSCISVALAALLSKSNVEDCVQTYSLMCSLLFSKMSLFAYGSIHQCHGRFSGHGKSRGKQCAFMSLLAREIQDVYIWFVVACERYTIITSTVFVHTSYRTYISKF